MRGSERARERGNSGEKKNGKKNSLHLDLLLAQPRPDASCDQRPRRGPRERGDAWHQRSGLPKAVGDAYVVREEQAAGAEAERCFVFEEEVESFADDLEKKN